MNVEYINPFIEGAKDVLSQIGFNPVLGKIFLKNYPYESNAVVVIVGITGKLRGQAIFSMSKDAALKIASQMMMGMEVAELDEMSKSAISELTNMILGKTATIFYDKGVGIEITPPSFLLGDNMVISSQKTMTVCVPLKMDKVGNFEIDIVISD